MPSVLIKRYEKYSYIRDARVQVKICGNARGEENRFRMTKELHDSISNSRRSNQIWRTDTSDESPAYYPPGPPFFRLSGRSSARRFFFIYRCLPPKTHAPHHYKIADYSSAREPSSLSAPSPPFSSIRLVSIARSEESKMAVSDRGSAPETRKEARGEKTKRRRRKERKGASALSAE